MKIRLLTLVILPAIIVMSVFVYLGVKHTWAQKNIVTPPLQGKRFPVKYADISGVHLAYYIRGKRTPLFMNMGIGMTMEDWDPLAAEHTLIIYEYRGIGRSTGDISNLTLTQMADDMAYLMRYLGLQKASIMVWSLGRFVAEEFAMKYPEKITSLILASPIAPGHEVISSSQDVETQINASQDKNWLDGFSAILFTHPNLAQAYIHRVREVIKKNVIPQEMHVSSKTKTAQEKALRECKQNDTSSRLRYVSVPTFVLVGGKDIIIPLSNSEIVANLIPNSHLVIVPDGGHAVLFEEPDMSA